MKCGNYGKISPHIAVRSGIRHGCCLSPAIFFTVSMNVFYHAVKLVSVSVSELAVVSLSTVFLGCILGADDIVIGTNCGRFTKDAR